MTTPQIIREWQQAWASLNPERVAALYCSDGTHDSAAVTSYMKRADTTLRGVDEIRTYAGIVSTTLKSFRADIIQVIAEGTDFAGRASVEYWRVVNGDEPNRKRVVEIIEWQNGKIKACRVFH
jgi:hypothetical protein